MSKFSNKFGGGKKRVAIFLREVAKTIDKYGWVKGTFGSTDSGFCIIGAANHVRFTNPKLAPIHYTLGKVFGEQPARFNDHIATCKEDVTGPLRRKANELEHGGTLG